jgi:hypothetical protein
MNACFDAPNGIDFEVINTWNFDMRDGKARYMQFMPRDGVQSWDMGADFVIPTGPVATMPKDKKVMNGGSGRAGTIKNANSQGLIGMMIMRELAARQRQR